MVLLDTDVTLDGMIISKEGGIRYENETGVQSDWADRADRSVL